MSKYSISVSIETCATHVIGVVECDSLDEFKRKAEELWESKDYEYPTENIHNDFDLGDWELSKLSEDEMKYYESK